jgi:hypothetical protein
MQRTAGCTKWDLKRNEDVMKERHTDPVLEYIQLYQKQWKNLQRMCTTLIPKAIVQYRQHGKKSFGRLVKR